MKKDIDYNEIPISVLFKIITRHQDIYAKHILKDTNITHSQVSILMNLLKKDDICQDELSQPLILDKGAVARTLQKLEDEGYITRMQDVENRRRNKISLTDKGRDIVIQIQESVKEREEAIINNMSISLEELQDLLLKFVHESRKFNDENLNDDKWEAKKSE